MKIRTGKATRPTPKQLAAVSGHTEKEWGIVLELVPVFVSGWIDDELIAYSYAHGSGISWTVERLWVATNQRRKGYGMQIRERLLDECAKLSTGTATVLGLFNKSTTPFWDKLPDEETNVALGGMREIRGKR
jgi:GNAT superfamily N-acetyltransferase